MKTNKVTIEIQPSTKEKVVCLMKHMITDKLILKCEKKGLKTKAGKISEKETTLIPKHKKYFTEEDCLLIDKNAKGMSTSFDECINNILKGV